MPDALTPGRPAINAAGAPGRGRAAIAAVLAAGAAAAGLFIAAHHPLGGAAACALFLSWALLNFLAPAAWLTLLPALLPVASLAPWTGWVALDEFDLLLLATAAGVHAHRAREAARGSAVAVPPMPRAARVLAVVLALSGAVALVRGWLDAGGMPGWFDAYLQPLNVWRGVKALCWSLLLLAALHEALQAAPRRALHRLRKGMLIGAALFVAAVLWERALYAGLLQFNASYRTTALFWEMHVGGAAIDAYAAMAMPFTLWALWRKREPLPWVAAGLLAAGMLYAALTTFSRGVYGAVTLPMLLPLVWWVLWRWRHGTLRGLLQAAPLTLSAALALLWAVEALEVQGLALLMGLWVLMALLVWRLTSVGWRAAAGVTLAVALLAEVAAVLGGGGFMRERFNASAMDLQARLAHWGRGLSLPQGGGDWLLGLGAGRLPAHYVAAPGHPRFSGAIRLEPGGVRLDGRGPGAHPRSHYGLTQRVAPHPGPHRVQLRLSADAWPARVSLKVCDAWLLYDTRCQYAQVNVLGPMDGRRTLDVPLHGLPLEAGGLPRAHVLTVGAVRGSVRVEEIRLYAGGEQLLRNGDFKDGLARWWPTAQDYYLPWHIDNLYLELLLERGALGLASFLALVVAALWRLARLGHGGDEALGEAAVFLAAALCGALLVGLFVSVMDMPRAAWLLWLLPWVALLLPRALPGGRAAPL
ncbi:hypothetical protein [Azohydromonas lata]|uniref:hypothetical protein n=1 Tax=Azohydromonas lata TaxID=45677 RepID=UPI000ACF4178|nr:hypothetical protein [Azohydromonas lata]